MKTIRDMTTQKQCYYSIFFIICNIYSIIVTYWKVLNGLTINNFVLIQLAGIIGIFFLFFFVRKDKYWKFGYILFLSAAILHAIVRLSSEVSNTIIISSLLISLLLSISAIFCFFKFKNNSVLEQ